MIAQLLRAVVAAETAVAATLVLVLIGASAVAVRSRQRDLVMLRWLRDAGFAAAAAPGGAPPGSGAAEELLRHLRGLTPHRRVHALLQILEPLTGEPAARLADLAGPSGVEKAALRWCRSRRWTRRLKGVRVLAAINAGATVLPALLRDRHPVVRAEAACLVPAHPRPEHIARLLEMLEDNQLRIRGAAKDALLRTGSQAQRQLAAFLAGHPAATADALEVAAGIANPLLTPAATQYLTAQDPELRRRAVRLLTATAPPQARDILEPILSGDPDAAVRAAAASGLGTLADATAAAPLARALGDPAWDVRRAAALSLRDLGPAGRIYLRRAQIAPDRFTADIARLVLDEPGVGDP